MGIPGHDYASYGSKLDVNVQTSILLNEKNNAAPEASLGELGGGGPSPPRKKKKRKKERRKKRKKKEGNYE